MSKAYYNEFDPYAAQWLRNLITAGHIAPGDVDQRSIEDVKPGDLTGYTQCHFFAGIGVWSYALRRAGWADSRPVWTGSCPCQPFSAAGKRNGFSDERHLWPAWFHLISQCLPNVIFGEQVAAADGLGWLDLVQADLEAAGYARGAVDLCAAGIGAPHIRQRLWIFAELADPMFARRTRRGTVAGDRQATGSGGACSVADTDQEQWGRRTDSQGLQPNGPAFGREQGDRVDQPDSTAYRMDNANDARSEGFGGGYQAPGWGTGPIRPVTAASEFGGLANAVSHEKHQEQQRPSEVKGGGCADEPSGCGVDDSGSTTGPTNGFWSNADWLLCRDGKWRPVEPGTFPLAHGIANRVGRLRAYGNAICAEAAVEFIKVAMDYRP